jgi:hypothetical protein
MRTIVFFLAALFATQNPPTTAREYYNEIYEAGGLDRMADQFVCFDDDVALKNFFIFSKSTDLRDLMLADGTFQKLPIKMQKELKTKEWLSIHGYNNGIPFNGEEFYYKDGSTWLGGVGDMDANNSMRIRLTINWATLRYKRAAEILDHGLHYKTEIARFGKCEEISPKVRQTANPE